MAVVSKVSSQCLSFSCCHLYRQCSDAKECLLTKTDKERAQQCTYRQSLENGTIFYGKNANTFSLEDYAKFISLYESTADALKIALDNLILYFVNGHYLSSRMVWFNSYEVKQLHSMGFIELHQNDKAILEKYPIKALKEATHSTLNKKDELINSILTEQSGALNELCEPFCYVQFAKEHLPYIIELYYDRFYNTPLNRYTGAVPFASIQPK